MAEQIPTAIQEELSIDYFKTFLDKIARYHDQVQVIDHYFKS